MSPFKPLSAFLLFALVFVSACKNKTANTVNKDSAVATVQHTDSPAVPDPAKKVAGLPASLTGTWNIDTFYFAQISAMETKTASQWLNQKLLISDHLHFSFEKIPAYKALFKGQEDCHITNADDPDDVPLNQYFDIIRAPMKELNIRGPAVTVYKTDCSDMPFTQFAQTRTGELIIQWDGAFFVLSKEK